MSGHRESSRRSARLLPRRSRTRQAAPRALRHALQLLTRSVERADAQRLNLALTASTLHHHGEADVLLETAALVGVILGDARDVLLEASQRLLGSR
jgi:hypothetical protein